MLSRSVVPDSVRPHRRQPTRLRPPGILQARTLEWVAISFSNAWKRKVEVKSLSSVRLSVTPWTAAYQAPLSMDFPGKSTLVCNCNVDAEKCWRLKEKEAAEDEVVR